MIRLVRLEPWGRGGMGVRLHRMEGRTWPLSVDGQARESLGGPTPHTTSIFRCFLLAPRQERLHGRLTPMDSFFKCLIRSESSRAPVVLLKANS